MPAQASITIKDGQSTPVDHVFAPKGARMDSGKNVANWRDNSQSQLSAKWTLDEFHSPATGKSGIEKFRYVLRRPTLVTTPEGASSVTRFAQAEITVILPVSATPEEVNDIHALVTNFTANAYFASAVTGREAAW